jgi:hypothetical protein
MDDFAGEQPLEVEELRARLRRISDEELRALGETAQNRCSLEANEGRLPQEVFMVQLHEAIAEWQRWHFKRK